MSARTWVWGLALLVSCAAWGDPARADDPIPPETVARWREALEGVQPSPAYAAEEEIVPWGARAVPVVLSFARDPCPAYLERSLEHILRSMGDEIVPQLCAEELTVDTCRARVATAGLAAHALTSRDALQKVLPLLEGNDAERLWRLLCHILRARYRARHAGSDDANGRALADAVFAVVDRQLEVDGNRFRLGVEFARRSAITALGGLGRHARHLVDELLALRDTSLADEATIAVRRVVEDLEVDEREPLLRHRDPLVRRSAVRGVRGKGEPRQRVALLLSALSSADDEVVETAASALGDEGAAAVDALPRLRELANSGRQRPRALSVRDAIEQIEAAVAER